MSSIKVVDVNNEAGANEPMPEPVGDCLNSNRVGVEPI